MEQLPVEGLPVPLTGELQGQAGPLSAQRFLFVEGKLRHLDRIVRHSGGLDAFVYDHMLDGCPDKRHFRSTFLRNIVVSALDALEVMGQIQGKGLDRLQDRFWKFVEVPEDTNDCWRWGGAKDPK